MEKKISLVFHPSYYEALQDGEFTQEEKGDILDALCRFQFYGEIPEFKNPKYKMFWKLVIPNINTSVNRYKAAVENGKKGGVAKGTEPWNKGKKSEPKANQTTNQIANQTTNQIAKQDIDIDIEIDNEKENDNNIEIDKKNKIEKENNNKIENFDTNKVGVEDDYINHLINQSNNRIKDMKKDKKSNTVFSNFD